MQGDQVLVELEPPKADGRRLGRIVRMLERRNPTVVGIFHYARSRSRQPHIRRPFRRAHDAAHPDSAPARRSRRSREPHAASRSGRRSKLARTAHHDDLEGLVVDVEITSWPTPTRPPMGRVIEVLGDPDDFGVDVEMMIRKHQLPRIFPDEGAGRSARRGASRRRRSRPPARFPRAAHRHHRRRNGARLRRCGSGDRARRRRLRTAGPHCRRGRICARGNRSRPGSAAARHQRLLPRSRHSHAAAGALDRHLQPAPRRRPAGAELHHAARRATAASRATRSSKASSAPPRA